MQVRDVEYGIDDILNGLNEQGYFADKKIGYAVLNTIRSNGRPLLLEGCPGGGKTSLAVAVSNMLHIPLIRLSCYEGITANQALYDYDYQKQLLCVSALKEKLKEHFEDKDITECVNDISGDMAFYGENFLIDRPILHALRMKGRKVLLIDEIDKADEELEHALYEVLDTFEMTIPEYGTIRCDPEDRPIVFLTSNGYRSLTEAFKRRCGYLYIEQKSENEIKEIIRSKVECTDAVLNAVSHVLVALQDREMRHAVSICEGIEWVKTLVDVFHCEDRQDVMDCAEYTSGLLAKNRSDIRIVEDEIRRA